MKKLFILIAVCLLGTLVSSAQEDTTGTTPAGKKMTRKEYKIKMAELKLKESLAKISADSATTPKIAEQNAKVAIEQAKVTGKEATEWDKEQWRTTESNRHKEAMGDQKTDRVAEKSEGGKYEKRQKVVVAGGPLGGGGFGAVNFGGGGFNTSNAVNFGGGTTGYYAYINGVLTFVSTGR